MAFEELHPLSKQYIDILAGNIDAGTHASDIVRYSGSIEDSRARIVQKAAGGGEDYVLWLEDYASGEAFQRLIVKGYLTGQWVDGGQSWEGAVAPIAVTEYQAG